MNITRRVTEAVDFEYMKAAIDAGNGPEFVRPFDELIIPLENGKSITAVCGGYVGDRRARFVLKDCLPELHVMNKRPTNAGGYLNSEGRRHVLEDILPLFPAWLRDAMKPRNMVETIDGEEHTYADTLWIPSATDIFGPSAQTEVIDKIGYPIGASATDNGITNGIGNGLFGSNNTCTRAQIVTFLWRSYMGK